MISLKVWSARISFFVFIGLMIASGHPLTIFYLWLAAGTVGFIILNRRGFRLKNWNHVESETLAINMIGGLFVLLAACSRQMVNE